MLVDITVWLIWADRKELEGISPSLCSRAILLKEKTDVSRIKRRGLALTAVYNHPTRIWLECLNENGPLIKYRVRGNAM